MCGCMCGERWGEREKDHDRLLVIRFDVCVLGKPTVREDGEEKKEGEREIEGSRQVKIPSVSEMNGPCHDALKQASE